MALSQVLLHSLLTKPQPYDNQNILFCFQDKIFGEAGSTVVIEEKLEGEEVSVSIHLIFFYLI